MNKIVRRTSAMYLGLVLILGLSLAASCAKSAPASAPAATTSAPAATIQKAPISTPNVAAKSITLKAVTYRAPKDPVSLPMTFLKNSIEKLSNGELKINIIGGPEAIPDLDQPEAVRKGAADFTLTAGSYAATMEPALATGKLFKPSPKEQRDNGLWDIHDQLWNKINLKLVAIAQYPQDSFLYVTKPITKPEDIAGMKFRASPGQQKVAVEHFGASAVTMSWGDAYTALQTGLIQGFWGTYSSASSLKLYEVCKYVINASTSWGSSMVIVMNQSKYNGLPENLQKVIQAAALEAEKETADFYIDEGKRAWAECEKGGMKRINFTPADTERYLKAVFDGAWEDAFKQAPYLPRKTRELAGS